MCVNTCKLGLMTNMTAELYVLLAFHQMWIIQNVHVCVDIVLLVSWFVFQRWIWWINGKQILKMTDKPQHEILKIEKREPHWKPWVNSSASEGWTYPSSDVNNTKCACVCWYSLACVLFCVSKMNMMNLSEL
jgi:hypothetical protein